MKLVRRPSPARRTIGRARSEDAIERKRETNEKRGARRREKRRRGTEEEKRRREKEKARRGEMADGRRNEEEGEGNRGKVVARERWVARVYLPIIHARDRSTGDEEGRGGRLI